MTIRPTRPNPGRASCQGGLTLIELMIAMVLGLIVVGGAVSVIIANRQTHRTNEAFSQIQESSRTAFELLARDIRQSASTPCGNTDRIANTLLASGGNWWQNWLGIRGYATGTAAPAIGIGAAVGDRVAGDATDADGDGNPDDPSDAIMLQGAEDTGLSIELHTVSSANVKINAATTSFTSGDILMACDFDHAAIFQVTNYNSNTVTVVHNTGTGNPGNCSQGLGFPTDCSSVAGNGYQFQPNSQIVRMTATTWYIGNNGRADEGGRSLFRRRLGPGGVLVTEEIVAGVNNMLLQYREGVNAALVAVPTNWNNVNAVQVTLTLNSADRNVSSDSSVNSGRLQRSFTTIVGLRNRIE